jgi:hypothetical protein
LILKNEKEFVKKVEFDKIQFTNGVYGDEKKERK